MLKGRVFIETGRLLIRQWEEKDLLPFFKLSTCPEVMKFYPKLLTMEEVKQFVEKSSISVEKNGFSFWAVEFKENSEFIGLIGLNSPLAPLLAIEIGWRLSKDYGGKGWRQRGHRCFKLCLFYNS